MKVLAPLLLLSLIVSAHAARAEPLAGGYEGNWEGELGEPPDAYHVQVRLSREDGRLSGTFSLPAEGVRDVPMASVEATGKKLVLRLTGARVFQGVLKDGEARGTLVMHDQGDRSIPMRLVREHSPAWDEFVTARDARLAASRAAVAARAFSLEQAAAGPAMDAVEPAALDSLLAAAAASGSTALVLTLDGRLVGEWYEQGESRKIEAMSATKSVLNLAVGRLLRLGLLESIDVPVHAFYPEWATGPHRNITVRHLLSHTSGLESPMPTHPIYASEDFVRFALDSALEHEPGTRFVYNNSATNLLAGVVGRAAGRPLDEFLRDDLFATLGITDFNWSQDRAGNPHGMAGLQIHARDLARLGELALRRGEWAGERLIDEWWFDESFQPGSGPAAQVGLLWWLIRDGEQVVGYSARGYLGQYLAVFPASGLVAVRMVEGGPTYIPETDVFRDFENRAQELGNAVGDLSGSESSASVSGEQTFVLRGPMFDSVDGVVRQDAVLVVTGREIGCVGAGDDCEAPADAPVVTVREGMILPGLIDIHVHARPHYVGAFPPAGVTTIRDANNALAVVEHMRRTPGAPRIFASGPLLDGPASILAQMSETAGALGEHELSETVPLLVADADEAAAAVNALAPAGVELVKLYQQLSPEAFHAAVAAAEANDLPVAADLGMLFSGGLRNSHVDIVQAAEAGVATIEHLSGLALAYQRRGAEPLSAGLDGDLLDDIAADLLATDVAIVPTLATLMQFAESEQLEWRTVPGSAIFEPALAGYWEMLTARGRAGAELIRADRDLARAMLQRLHEGGITIGAGSDVPAAPFMPPGGALHLELEALVSAGLSPAEALQAATWNNALLLGRRDLGRLVPGAVADIVVVDGDPTAEISATRRIRAVWQAGRPVELDTAWERVAAAMHATMSEQQE